MDYITFAGKIKAKYPEYNDVDDKALAHKMIAKYPQYHDIEFNVPDREKPFTAPLGEIATIEPETQSYLRRLKNIPQDIATGYQESAKGMAETISQGKEIRKEKPLQATGETALGMAGNAVGAVFTPLSKTAEAITSPIKNKFLKQTATGAVMGAPFGGLPGALTGAGIGAAMYGQEKLFEIPAVRKYFDEHPNIERNITNAENVAMGLLGGRGKKIAGIETDILNKPVSKAIPEMAKNVAKTPLQAVGMPLELAGKGLSKLAQPNTQKATEIYRDILRPTQGEIRKIELRKGKDINDYYKLAAEENLPIESTPDKKLNTSVAREQLQPKREALETKLQDTLSTDKTPKIDLMKIGEQVKQELKTTFPNAEEYNAQIKKVDSAIGAEIAKYGSNMVTGSDANAIKRGFWSIAYNEGEPTTYATAQKTGHVIKEAIERSYPDKNIRALNEKAGKYSTLNSLLERAQGRVIKGGKLGSYFARTTGAVIGAGTKLPFGLGGFVGAIGGEAVSKFATSPERLSAKAGKMAQPNIPLQFTGQALQKAGKYIENPTIPDVLKGRQGQRGGIQLGKPDTKVSEPLVAEARKYKTAEEFIKAQEIQGIDSGVRNEAKFGLMEDQRLSNSPDLKYIFEQNGIPQGSKEITIYRSAPGDIRSGDFAGLNKETAENHLRNPNDKIFSKKVPISDLIQGADQYEVIYAPIAETKTKSQLTDIWNKSRIKTLSKEQSELAIKEAELKELGADLTDMEQYGDPYDFPNYEEFLNQYDSLQNEIEKIKAKGTIPEFLKK